MIVLNGVIAEELERLSSQLSHHRMTKQEHKDLLMDFVAFYIGAATPEPLPDPGPKAIRAGEVSVKTIGQLIDELTIMNERVWHLIDKVIAGTATPEEAQMVQQYNAKRNEYVRELDSRFEQADIGAKVYASKV